MNDGTYNFYNKDGKLYIGDGTDNSGNGAYDKSIANARLPVYYQNTMVHGTWSSCFESIQTLIYVFVPETYKEIQYDFCWNCNNLESLVFEDNSQIESIDGWLVGVTKIESITLPSSLKTLNGRLTFYQNTKLKQIIFMGNIAFGSGDNVFTGVPSDLVILVGKEYPTKTFGGREVKVISLPSPKRILTCPKHRKIDTHLTFMIALCYS